MEEKISIDKRNSWMPAVFAVITAVLLYDCLFRGMPLGINVIFIVAEFYGAVFLTHKGEISFRNEQNWILLLLIAGFSATFFIYNNPLLLFLNTVALLLLIPVQVGAMMGNSSYPAYSFKAANDICYFLFVRPFHKIGEAFSSLFVKDGEKKQKKTAFSIVLGVIIAMPVIVILLVLLASADIMFSKMLTNLLSFQTVLDTVGYLFTIILFWMLSSSLLRSLRQKKRTQFYSAAGNPARFNLVTVYVILISVNILLFVFAAVQCTYLFGLASLPSGITYSSYARTGFFQLCAAAVLVFSLTAICMAFTKHAEKKQRMFLNILYTLLNVSTIFLLVTSFSKMVLYEQEFMFTQLRLYVQAFIILLGLVIFYTVIRIWRPKFNIGKFISLTTAVCLLGLSFFNVDAFIAAQNSTRLTPPITAEQYQTDGVASPCDIDYLLTLSADAVPYYINSLGDNFVQENIYVPDSKRYEFNQVMWQRASTITRLYDTCTRSSTDLRSYNINRQIVKQLLDERPELVKACRDYYQKYRSDYEFSFGAD